MSMTVLVKRIVSSVFEAPKRRLRIRLLDFSNQFYLPPILCFSSHFDFGWELVEETREL
jgi:hypothetical protein